MLFRSLELKQIEFWKKLYFNGLGEFFYTNGIITTEDAFMNIVCEDIDVLKPINFDVKEEFLVPIGGGKDSVVTLEMLKSAKCNVTPLIINPRKASLDCIQVGGFGNDDFFEIKRTIDPLLLTLNEDHLNGHTPFSAMLAFVSLLAAALTGKKYIALSNEVSANEPTVTGHQINHQYSKSLEFENDFRRYAKAYITADIDYFSFLRISELKIAQLFSQLNYRYAFRSCNAGSKQDIWCGNCSKCLFVFIILSPFLDKEELKSVFGKNLFALSTEERNNDLNAASAQMKEYFLQLIGQREQKPFECVGTIKEVNTAIALYVEKNGINDDDDLIKLWFELNKDQFENILQQKDALLSQSELTNLPKLALKAYQKDLL